MGMFDMFQQGGALYTGAGESPGVEKKLDAGGDPAFAEKGSILGMTPSTFASVAGQAGAALTPQGSWQNKLGSVASQMGSQKLNQLMQAEKEKRATDMLKRMFGVMTHKQLGAFGGGAAGVGTAPVEGQQSATGIKPMTDLEFAQGGR